MLNEIKAYEAYVFTRTLSEVYLNGRGRGTRNERINILFPSDEAAMKFIQVLE